MIFTTTLRGIEAHIVQVEATREKGLPSIRVDGLAPAAEREARVRVQAALAACRRDIDESVYVRCDAGGARIDGTCTDLAIALAVACDDPHTALGALGELSLSGEVRPVRGVLAAIEELREHVRVAIVAPENAAEAALVHGIRVVVARRLSDAIEFALTGGGACEPVSRKPAQLDPPLPLDMRDLRGMGVLRRAMEIAAAGSHNLLLIGPPGAGKTMAARRLTGILPPMTEGEQLEVTRVHSAAGLNIGGGLVVSRPFRAPHHSTTPPGLIGGGAALPRLGEVTLAHRGVLFLDELPEFSRSTLEALSEPIKSGEVVLARAAGTIRYPSRCLVVGAVLPCPCGHFPDSRCRCTDEYRTRYRARIPQTLHELFDLRVRLSPFNNAELDEERLSESSAIIVGRVARARVRDVPPEVTIGDVLNDTARAALAKATRDGRVPSLSARDRVLRVARTIARLADNAVVSAPHIAEALDLAPVSW